MASKKIPKKRSVPSKKEKKLTARKEWENKFLEKITVAHKRNLLAVTTKILKRIDSTKNGLVSRSKKYGVPCDITIEELRQLVYDAYGTKCKYCDKILTIRTFVFDHIIPISRQGPSTKNNIQLICKTSNGVKGSLDEENLLLLLKWLDTAPEALKTDILIRLGRGIH